MGQAFKKNSVQIWTIKFMVRNLFVIKIHLMNVFCLLFTWGWVGFDVMAVHF